MAKTAEVVAEQASEPAPADTVTLDEFCTRLSETDRRVELLGAFHHTEQRAGNVRDTAEAFRARFDDFVNKPV